MFDRSKYFTMRLSPDEKIMLRNLALHFERTQSDALRLLIRKAHKNFGPNAVEGGGNPDWPGNLLPGQVAVGPLPDEVSAAEAVPA